MMFIDGGKAKRQPVVEYDLVKAIEKIASTEESKGQIYELGGSSVYTIKELTEFFANNLNLRPFYVDYTYDELMRLYLSPNSNWEKAAHWMIVRPDYLTRLRSDNVLTKKEGVKTFEDLGIIPLATHHYISEICNWLIEKKAVERQHRYGWAEIDADDEGAA